MIYVKRPDGNEGVACINNGVLHLVIYIRALKVWDMKFRYLI